uniref:Transposase Tnp1/En/Spm-like domain-containing protein n=1 Tax=Zea mays TaxID=4577 RepID=A0A804U828_MAIZE
MSWSSRVSLTGSRTWTTGMTLGRTSPTTTGGGLRPRESTREKGMGVQYEAATIELLSSSSSSPIRQAPAIPRSSYRTQPAAIAPGAAITPDDAGCPPGSRYAAARRAPSSLLSPPYALQDPVEMPRGRRKQTVESNEEYLSEDHVGQKKLQKTLAHESDTEMEEESFAVGGHDQSGEVSEMEPNSKNPTDMDADIEVEDEETNVEVKRRGKTKLLQVWNIPRGHRIVVQCNELDQPIGEEAGIMGKFLGMVARNGNLCSLSYKDWRLLIGKKERLTNEQKNKEDILKQVKELLAEHPEFADTSQGKIAWNGDALNKILGEEKPGHVHGLGLVPNPNKVLDGTTSRRLNQLHVTSLDPTASEDVLSLKLQMEKLTRQFELERDITFDNTKLANSSKSMTKEPTSTSLNEEASKNQVKRKDMQSATTFDKTKCATTSKGTPGDRPTDESILTGAQVFLKSWRCPTKTVALGTVLGRDPNHKVGGVKLGREFWMVRVRLVILPIEPLIRPYDNMEVIGDVGNNLIAWPSCCV